MDIVSDEIRQERERRGEQNHPALTGDATVQCDARAMFGSWAEKYRANNRREFDPRDTDRRLDWTGILLEEVYAALSESDPAKIRTELVQVAAVAAAWIECIDRSGESVPGVEG
ncbi:hypothetical protein ACH4FX_12170 [Streptomyces sp. NPDC018019]|uniref:hypothetical protein n=1 Tax=Streptomyces sp. NPDC018019 TaxID=3365030 RepID=UPI0037B00857